MEAKGANTMLNELAHVGTRLRTVRRSRGWTLDELAEKSGISASTLSRLESGKRQASLELLVPLTRLLGIRVDDLITLDAPDPRVRRPVISRDGLIIAPLAPEASPVHTYKITFPPGGKLPDLCSHDGYEWLYVLTGRLRLRLGEQDLTLESGEAAEYDTRIPHATSAAGTKPAQIISIFNDEGARMHTRLAAHQDDD
ncbi:helix-turn-helix domain-containing protein [Streptomyces tendae]